MKAAESSTSPIIVIISVMNVQLLASHCVRSDDRLPNGLLLRLILIASVSRMRAYSALYLVMLALRSRSMPSIVATCFFVSSA